MESVPRARKRIRYIGTGFVHVHEDRGDKLYHNNIIMFHFPLRTNGLSSLRSIMVSDLMSSSADFLIPQHYTLLVIS
jgi:hypothetical protein